MSERFCAKCSFLALTEVVSCSGRCQRSFHRACAGLSEASFATLTEGDENGVAWFCVDCRKKPAEKATQDSGENFLSLPPEVLAHILQYLKNEDLLRVRHVCRRVRDVVDATPALVGLRKIYFRQVRLEGDYTPQNLIAARNVDIRESAIASVDHWWPQMGAQLVRLNLDCCRMDFSTFHALLGETPQLERLHIRESFFIGRIKRFPRSGRRLTKLKELVTTNTSPEPLPSFSGALGVTKFAQLKTFKFWQRCPNSTETLDQCIQDAVDILRRAQDTLEELEMGSYTQFLLQELNNLPRLRLKRVRPLKPEELQSTFDMVGWSSFLRTQANTLEDIHLEFKLSSEDLSSIGQLCPHLKRVYALLRTDTSADFLRNMPLLESLRLLGGIHMPSMDFGNFSSPALKKLDLSYYNCRNISQYLLKSPNMQEIMLHACDLDDYALFLWAIQQSHETLKRLDVRSRADVPLLKYYEMTKTFNKLTHLSINVRFYPKEALLNLLAVCPQLEDVEFSANSLDDEVILALVLGAKRLRKIILFSTKNLTYLSAVYIYRHCPNLTQLYISTLGYDSIWVEFFAHLRKGSQASANEPNGVCTCRNLR